MKNRVFIVAAGVIAASGSDYKQFSHSLRSVQPGIRLLTGFPLNRLACHTGGMADRDIAQREVAGLKAMDCGPLGGQRLSSTDELKLGFALCAARETLRSFPEKLRSEVELHLGAGLEAIYVERILPEPATDSPICPEIPPALLGDALAALLALKRPARTQVSACAASAQAILAASQRVQNGHCSFALAGGVDSMLNPFGLHAFHCLGALASGTDPLRPFDCNRSGTLLGEGAAFVLLATEKACQENNLTLLAEFLGGGTSCDARHPVMPDPEGAGAILAMQRALKHSNLTPDELQLLNAHGSGTRQNDKVEALAIRNVFDHGRNPPYIQASKPYFGHMLAAGGAIELLVVLDALRDGICSPTPGLTEPDPECSLRHLMAVTQIPELQNAMSVSFGLNGQNAAIILRKV